MEEFIANVSEPFQLFSFGLATKIYLLAKKKGKVIITNPILFDAS